MTEAHVRHRRVVRRVFEELAHGNTAPLREACADDVTWWLPLGPRAEHRGATAVEQVLRDRLGRPGSVTGAVIVDEDGGPAVVEQLLQVGGRATPATSVVTVRDGVIVAGRTYVDVEAWDEQGTGPGHVAR
jgi:ketosteroid isomerase-like protein